MRRFLPIGLIFFSLTLSISAQSGRTKGYSESTARNEKRKIAAAPAPAAADTPKARTDPADLDVIKIETDLVTIPVRVTDKSGRAITNIKQEEFKIFENGVEKEIAYFSDVDEPFTVALMLDMSYSSVFKLADIQDAAKKFVAQLRPGDKVMVVSFAEKPIVLCEATNDRKVLDIAIEGARIASGTSLYTALDVVLNEKLKRVTGRKAIVLLSDGVDTSSKTRTAEEIEGYLSESDILLYPVRYNTYEDVQKTRRTTAPIQYDENDKPYMTDARPGKGERVEDYEAAKEFLKTAALYTGGRLHNVNSTTNLDQAFANIANELRKTYSLGYYPNSDRENGASVSIKVRVYRPDLSIRARESYSQH